MTDLRDRAVALYDAYTHDHLDRRRLLREMTLLAGSAAAAEALILGIGASPAAAQQVAAEDARILTSEVRGREAGAPSFSYAAGPKSMIDRPAPVVLVVHENRGLNAHIRDVARRLAVQGFWAIAPDFLAPQGGTPDDQDLARTMIGKLDYDLALAQAQAVLSDARGDVDSGGKGGAVGFCWGGAFVNRLAVAAGPTLGAGVSYYGPAPAPTEAVRVAAPLMLHLPEKDARVAATVEPWAAALRAAGKRVELHRYPGVDHAFNNDTSAERYDKATADLAWGRTIAFLRRELDGAG